MTKEQISKYYLDLKLVNSIQDEKERDMIHNYFRDMLIFADESRYTIADPFFYTLCNSGYIKNYETEQRAEKIGELING